MATSMPAAKPDTKAQPDPFQQPALANALMVGKTFTQLAPPGAGGGVGRPAYPAQRGEGFQQPPGRKPTSTERIRSQQAARKAGPQSMPSATGYAPGKMANPFEQV